MDKHVFGTKWGYGQIMENSLTNHWTSIENYETQTKHMITHLKIADNLRFEHKQSWGTTQGPGTQGVTHHGTRDLGAIHDFNVQVTLYLRCLQLFYHVFGMNFMIRHVYTMIPQCIF